VPPAGRGIYSASAALRFFREVYPSLGTEGHADKPLDVLQQAGDCIYLPPHWSHGVMNVQMAVGVGWEFTEEYLTTWGRI
jgi:hypothetical protein